MAASTQHISINNHMSAYKTLMTTLTTEKDGVTEEKKKGRQEKMCLIAKKIFAIEEDDTFKAKMDAFVKEITSIKPGRKLIKALEAHNSFVKITKGAKFAFDKNVSQLFGKLTPIIIVPEGDKISEYTIDQNGEKRSMKCPSWLGFTHELIHALHFFSDSKRYDERLRESKNLLYNMDDLEEQLTIIGYDPQLFAQPNRLKLDDILCQNAFHMALGLPIRIDHQVVEDQTPALTEKPKTYDFYYSWLEKELKNVCKIPQDKKNDLML